MNRATMAWCGLVTCGIVLCGVSPVLAADAVDLAARLQSDDFRVREAATRELADAGPEMIPVIAEIARKGDLESALRAGRVLGRIYGKGDEASFLTVENVLRELAASDRASVAERAGRSLEDHYALREQHAVRRLEKMGAVIHNDEQAPQIRFPGIQPDGPQRVERIALSEDYTGGAAGLKEIARLNQLKFLYYVPDAVNIPAEAMNELLRELPNLSVQVRGQAYLGVAGNGINRGNIPGFTVTMIKAGSAADKAGMRGGDVIVAFGEAAVTDFDDLVTELKQHKPGETVSAKVLRGGEQMELSVVLTGWQ